MSFDFVGFGAFGALFFGADEALSVFAPPDAFDDFDDFDDFAAPPVFDDFALPEAVSAADFAFAAFARAALLSSLSIKSPTASATTLSALKAAPVAAPVRISPAASLTASKTGDSCLRVDFFAPDFAPVDADFFVSFDFDEAADFDFAPVALLVEADSLAFDFAAVSDLPDDFAGAADFVVDF